LYFQMYEVQVHGARVYQLPAVKPILGDNSILTMSGVTVTAIFDDCFYVETTDRSSGIRVEMPRHFLQVGSVTKITGTILTNTDGERYIEATAANEYGTGVIQPLGMSNKALGGSDWNYDPTTGAGQRGVEDGVGLNNIGLLVKTTGVVTVAGDDFFYIDDGTHARDASAFNGIRVRCQGLEKPVADQQVSITGISTIKNIGGRYFRSIRPRTAADIQVIQ
jgi:hypothetical protein